MKTLAEFVEEVVFLEGPYLRTHGRPPKKLGCYKFSTQPNADDQDDRFHYMSTYTTYDLAKKEATRHFAYSKYIYVMP